ncbi:MAG: hypothetical protein ACI9AU_001400 [Bacteroidia bacterium]|jgi:hypothetical protein
MDKIKKYLSEGIPTFFHSYETDSPFDTCTFCTEPLSRFNKYGIEKVFKQNKMLNSKEIVYEYAICWGCATSMGGEISEDSRSAISALFAKHNTHLTHKLEYLHSTEKYNLDSWIERCSLTGKETRLCDEFAVSGIIEDNRLVYEHSPMVVSDDFMRKLQDVLSLETKESFDKFREQLVDGPFIEDLIFSPTPGLI